MLSKDELFAKLTTVGTTEDAAERRMLLTEITDDLGSVYDANDVLTEANTKFATDNKKLQEYNMQLYLKLGSQTKQEDTVVKTEEKPKLKYEDLFNDKGELK